MTNNDKNNINYGLPVINSSFSFTNPSCNVLLDTVHDRNGNQYKNIRVKNSAEKQIEFHFKQGLYRKTDFAEKHNILMDFISIPYGNEKKLIRFFEENGFIFQNSTKEYVLYSCTDLFLVIRRVKFLVELIMELQKETPSFNVLIKNILYFLLTGPLTISITNSDTRETSVVIYKSTSYELQDILKSLNILTSIPLDIDYNPEAYTSMQSDSKVVSKTFFDEQEYDRTYHYVFRESLPSDILNQFSLLDYVLSISEIESIDSENGVILPKLKKKSTLSINAEHVDIIKKVAKCVIKTELDHNTSKIIPSYNSDALLGSWSIPDLISSIYFSVFFLNPNFEIIKKCANPTCSNYYSVLHSNTRKKYCSIKCANAVSQRKARARRNFKKGHTNKV
ncbi:CGNR zinc finger domain-containing protein [Caloranaerobacter ferrireducens]|uniref:CGNR zinc finger domain-containing protein n=1 Tax=Caloranaerobacter ferrireducens TaxID=1323370 RepID=UPI00084DB276|nr:CGNR zinc finger domain-containing protein [Caloranaerobacter ferrireducens]